jgi:hypothetical protein
MRAPTDFPRRSIAAVVWLAATLASASAQDLGRLEREFIERRQAIVRPLLEAYAQKLEALHDTLKRRGDRVRAIVVQTERNRILASAAKALPPNPASVPPTSQPAPVNPPAGESATLSASGAALRIGDQKFSGHVNTHLVKKGAVAEWKLPKLRSGRYRLTLVYTCVANAGGHCQLVIPPLPPVKLSIEPNGEQREIDLGEFDFRSSPESLRLEFIELADGAEQLMAFESLRIKRADSDGPPGDDAPAPALAPLNL